MVGASGASLGLQYHTMHEEIRRTTGHNSSFGNASVATVPKKLSADQGPNRSDSDDVTTGKRTTATTSTQIINYNVSSTTYSASAPSEIYYDGGAAQQQEDAYVIHTKYSGDLRTHDEVVKAMGQSDKYRHFVPLIKLLQGIQMPELKRILLIIEHTAIRVAEPDECEKAFSEFCFSIISPLCEKSRSESLDADVFFSDVLDIVNRASKVEQSGWAKLREVVEKCWQGSIYKNMLFIARVCFEQYHILLAKRWNVSFLSPKESEYFNSVLLNRVLEEIQEY